MQYDFICMTFWKMQDNVPVGVRGKAKNDYTGSERMFRGDETILCLHCGVGYIARHMSKLKKLNPVK